MAERFSRLFQLDEEIFSSGSPVLIAAGVLLKDSVTDSIVVQLKLQNISLQSIVAAKVKLLAYDVAGKEIPGIDEYQYLDLNVRTGECWGGDKAIILPETETRSFLVKQIAVLYSSSRTWESINFAGASSLPKGLLLERELSDSELTQYRMMVNQSAKYVPAQYGEVWRCPCGAINYYEQCHNCHATKEKVFSAFDIPTLSEKAREHIADEQARKAEREEQRKKRAKKFKWTVMIGIPVIALVLFVALWLVPNVIEPYSRYSNACALVEAGQFDEAIAAFEDLGAYKDAADRIITTKLEKAEALADAGEYKEALNILNELAAYEDVEQRICEVKYSLADEMAQQGDFTEARIWFEELGEYGDSAERLKEVRYCEADAKEDGDDYKWAIQTFSDLGNYKDAAERVEELQDSVLSMFSENIQSGNYEEAYTILTAYSDVWPAEISEQAELIAEARYSDLVASGQNEEATELSETLQLAPERAYATAIELMQSGDYGGAHDLLAGIADYKVAGKLMEAIENRIDGVYSHDGDYYMWVTTFISTETGTYMYRASRWYWGQLSNSRFSQGKLSQTLASDIDGDLIFEYAANYYRWTVSADKTQIVVEEMAGDYATYKGKVMETVTWSILDDETATDALRQAKHLGIV